MKYFAKRATERLVAPLGVPGARVEHLPFGLRDSDVLYAAALGALSAAAESLPTTSDWSGLSGKRTEADRNNTSSWSFLRVEASTSTRFDVALGACSPSGKFVADWTIRGTLDPGTSTVVLTVPSCRTLDGELVNARLFEVVRQRLIERLAVPPTIVTTQGVGDLEGQLEPLPLPKHSSLRSDYVVPVPDCFGPERAIVLDADDLGGPLRAAFLESGLSVPVGSPGCVARLDLSGGSARHIAYLDLSTSSPAAAGGTELRFVCPGWQQLSLVGTQRLFRHTLRTLLVVSAALPGDHPARAAITGYVDRCLVGARASDRMAHVKTLWSDTVPGPALRVYSGARVPVAVVAARPTKFSFDDVRRAERSLLVRQRTWARGYSTKKRDKTRTFAARRPFMLSTRSGETAPYLRYGQITDDAIEKSLRADIDNAWFWEAAFRSDETPDGAHRGALVADGLSTTSGFLAYASELFALYRGWAHHTSRVDPDTGFLVHSVVL